MCNKKTLRNSTDYTFRFVEDYDEAEQFESKSGSSVPMIGTDPNGNSFWFRDKKEICKLVHTYHHVIARSIRLCGYFNKDGWTFRPCEKFNDGAEVARYVAG